MTIASTTNQGAKLAELLIVLALIGLLATFGGKLMALLVGAKPLGG